MSLKFHSTRGNAPILDFEQTVLAGLAEDGGLYLPESLPEFTAEEMVALSKLEYPALAAELLWPFFEGQKDAAIGSKQALNELFIEAYSTFHHAAIAPLVQVGADEWIQELFHGPTLAFKDFALQFLGLLLDKLLTARNQQVTVLGATSGDTGSAAIAGCAGSSHITTVMLHPHERVSPIQRRQMTTIHDARVHNLAIEGSFDDCQNIVKALFVDLPFRKAQQLTAVNSINWARIMAQIVYYFYSALRLGAPAKQVHFSVPTGNFGDIYAGYLAKKMGLPLGKLIIASNRNDILTRCVMSGTYKMESVIPSLSPSMDIQISSNFERLLYGYYDEDAKQLLSLMNDLKQATQFILSGDAHQRLQADFAAYCTDDERTKEVILRHYEATGMVIDPHTAVGVAAANALRPELEGAIVTLATAHPAKFPDAVKMALKKEPELPEHVKHIMDKQERYTVLPATPEAVKEYIEAI